MKARICNFKSIITMFLILSMIISPFANFHAKADGVNNNVFYGNGFEVKFEVISQWAGAFNGNITIKNTSSTIIDNWTLKFNMKNEISNIWNASVDSFNDGVYCIKNASWNQDIPVGGSVSFGFTAKGDEVDYPTNYGIPIGNVKADEKKYKIDFIIYSDWGTGFSAAMNITNNSDMVIEDWIVEFDFEKEITEIWNGVIQQHIGNHYVIKNAVHNQNIAPRASVTIGFNGKDGNVGNPPSNYILNASNMSDEIISDEELYLYADAQYNSDKNSIDIKWLASQSTGKFEILESNNNIDFEVIDTVENQDSYTYSASQSFEIKYFKIRQTSTYGKTKETFSLVVKKDNDGYKVQFIDTDEDRLPDYAESEIGTNINLPDTDADNLTDYQELYLTNTDPLIYNSVAENLSDAEADSDKDGISNIDEISLGTDPMQLDTDGDHLNDYEEINTYKTNPLVSDSDKDSISDSDELHLGLDPLNPQTYGVPDADYKVAQTITSNSDVLSVVNTVNNPYKLSIDMKAAGYVEGGLSVKESSYSKTIQSDSLLGIVPELTYNNLYDVEKVTLKFEVAEEYISNVLGTFPGEEEMSGIKRLNIFKYFEELNMLLPIKTQFDEANNILYTEVDELGTYCIMDMELWLKSFDEDQAEYQSSRSMLKTVSAEEMDRSDRVFTEDETRITAPKEDCSEINLQDIALETEDLDKEQKAENENTAKENNTNENNTNENSVTSDTMSMQSIPTLISMNTTTIETPVDVVFILQTAGTHESSYNAQKQMIKTVTDQLFDTYSDVRICIIEYKENAANIVESFSCKTWLINSTAVSVALNKLTYETNENYCNRGTAFSLMLKDIVFKDNAGKFVFQIMNGNTTVGSGYFSQLDACEQLEINYSEIMPVGFQYRSEVYAQMVANAIAKTNGLSLVMSNNIALAVYNHIISHVAPPQVKFNAIIPTGWKKIVLKGVLDPDNGVKSDEDLLTDWEEVDTDKIDWDTEGNVLLPTIQECIGYAMKPYAVEGLERFKSASYVSGMPLSDFEKYLYHVLNTTCILPIHSDPTLADSDEDSYQDQDDPRPFRCDVNKVQLKNVLDYVPVEYDGPETYSKSVLYYGGNQSWFYDKSINTSLLSYFIENGGCGALATTDLLIYLTMMRDETKVTMPFGFQVSGKFSKPYIAYSDYDKFVRDLVNDNKPIYIVYPMTEPSIIYPVNLDKQTGVEGITFGYLPNKIAFMTRDFIENKGLDMDVRTSRVKDMKKDEFLEKVLTQIKNDIPIPIVEGSKTIDMHQIDPHTGEPVSNSNGPIIKSFQYHWVNIVGVVQDDIKGSKVLEIASWGKKYFIDFDTYYEASDILNSVIWID